MSFLIKKKSESSSSFSSSFLRRSAEIPSEAGTEPRNESPTAPSLVRTASSLSQSQITVDASQQSRTAPEPKVQTVPMTFEDTLRYLQDSRDVDRTPPSIPPPPPIHGGSAFRSSTSLLVSSPDNYFLFDDDRVDKKGWLTKEGRIVKNWKRRWFVLQGNSLKYYEDETEKEIKGFIDISTSVVRASLREGRQCLEILVEGRKLVFHTDAPEEQREWMLTLTNKISCLSYIKKSRMMKLKPNEAVIYFLQKNSNTMELSNQDVGLEGFNSLSHVLRYYTELKKLVLSNCGLDDLVLQLLCDGLRGNNRLEWVDFSRNKIGPSGSKFLAHALSANVSITYLNLSKNRIGDDGLEIILTALTMGDKLKRLIIDHNNITEIGAGQLAKYLSSPQCRLLSIDLANNSIGDIGMQAIAKPLEDSTTVYSLDVEGNKIGDAGAASLATLLTKNRSLVCLDLSRNAITPESGSALSDAVRASPTIQFLDWSGNVLSELAIAGVCSSDSAFTMLALQFGLRTKMN